MLCGHRYVRGIAQLFGRHGKHARSNCRSQDTEEKQVVSFWTVSICHAGRRQVGDNPGATFSSIFSPSSVLQSSWPAFESEHSSP